MTEQAIQHELPVYSCMPVNTTSQYSNEDRIRAISAFITLGNFQKVSESVDIPRTTIQEWSKSEWWQEAIVAIRQEKAEEFDVILSNIVQEGFLQAHDRLSKGNHAYTKDGEYIGRQEMSGRDIGTLTGIMYDKLRIHRNMPTSISSNGGTDAKLEILASKMMELSRQNDAKVVSDQPKTVEKVENSSD